MNLQATSLQKSRWKNPLLYSSFVLICVALYVVCVLYSRHESNLRYLQQTKQREDQQRHQEDLQAIEQLGGTDLAIRSLYVSPSAIRPGQSAQLCYDVANAKTVALDPPVAAVWPSHSRCIDLTPKKTTVYKLSISSTTGEVLSQTVTLRVQSFP